MAAPRDDRAAAPRGRLARLWAGIDDRTGLGAAGRFVADHEVHGGARFAYALGSALVFVFILQVVTGIALASAYSPSVTTAWGSVYYIEHHMVMGAFVRGVHHFGSSAMIVLAVLHMTQVLFFGAHRKPREANWIVGVVMLLLILAFGLTGYLLPWDQKGYWATRVATGILGGTPGGEPLQTLIQGGAEYGNQTLTRFYAIHVFILPISLGTLIVAHLALFYRHGVKRSPRSVRPAAKRRPTQPFWPFQMLRDVVVAVVVFGAIAALALLVGVGLEAPADPASGYEARPEWYFLFLYQLLKYFEGPLVLVGTMVLPGLAVLFLLAAPFIDRKAVPPERSGPSRRVAIPYVALLAGVAILTALALANDAADDSYQQARAAAAERADRAAALAHEGGIDAAGRVVLLAGADLYREQGCASCHDAEPPVAPRLSGYGSRERLSAFLLAPDAPEHFGATALAGQMDAFPGEAEELPALVDYLLALGQAGGATAAHARGRAAFEANDCTLCHNDPAASVHDADAYDLRATGPDLDGLYGDEWTRQVVRWAGHPARYGGAIGPDAKGAMPRYDALTDDELDLLVGWLRAGAPGAR